MGKKRVDNYHAKNFRKEGRLYLVYCPNCKLENYSPAVSSGVCAWCGWDEQKPIGVFDHYTLPDFEDSNSKAGVGPFNFSFMFKDAKDIVEWHDLITKAGSFAERIRIPNKRVADHFREMLKLRNEELARNGKISGLRGIAWNIGGMIVKKVHRLFYRGPLG